MYLNEEFSGLNFQLTPDTFFQVNTKTAEKLIEVVIQELALNGSEIIVDAYCGIGTFTLPLAKYLQQVGVCDNDSMEIAGEELLQMGEERVWSLV